MLFILWVVGAIVAIIVLALVFAPSFIDESAIVALAQEQVRKNTGGELVVRGNTEIALFPRLVLVMDDSSLDLPAQSPDGNRIIADIQTIDIGLSIIPLLTGDTEVGQVRLEDATVRMLNSSGITQSEFRIPKVIASHLNTANNPMDLSARIELINLDQGAPIVVEIDGAVRVPSGFSQLGIDRLETTITGALTKPVKASLDGTIIRSPLQANLNLLGQLPGGDIDGDLSYNTTRSPQIELTLDSPRLDLNQLQPANGEAQATPTEANDNPLPPIPIPVGPLRDLDMRLTVTADSLLSGSQEVTNAQLLLRVVDGISDLKYLRGVFHEGQLDTAMQIDVRNPAKAEVTLAGGLKGVELNSLLNSLGGADVARGHVDMDWDMETAGLTVDELKLGLDGQLNMTGRNVEITAVSAQEQMCEAIAEINQESLTAPMPETTDVSALAMVINFGGGNAKLERMDIATPGVTLSGRGTTALSNADFSARLTANIDKTLEELDKACRVRDRYIEVDWPVKCQGNLVTGDPSGWCQVDLESIVKQLLENEAKSELRKQAEKAGGKLLQKLFGT